MPLNSVQQYVQGVINGISIPGQSQPLVAYVTPPMMDKAGGPPKAYVWGGRMEGGRRSMPRGPAFKRLTWLMDIYLTYETNPNRPTIGGVTVDAQFPLIVDAVMLQLWTTTMPLFITDPQTGYKSQIWSIGETFSIDYPPERSPATLRMLWYSMLLTVRVEEDVQA